MHQVVAIPSQSPKWTQPRVGLFVLDDEQRAAYLDRDIKECTDAQPRWDAVWKDAVAAEPLVDPVRRDYYQAEMLTMITINRNSNRMLLDVAQSMKDSDAGETAKAESEAADALKSLDEIQASMRTAEYGKWKNWYRGDWLTGVYRTHELVQYYLDNLKDPMSKLPAPAYFHIMQYEDDRSVDVH